MAKWRNTAACFLPPTLWHVTSDPGTETYFRSYCKRHQEAVAAVLYDERGNWHSYTRFKSKWPWKKHTIKKTVYTDQDMFSLSKFKNYYCIRRKRKCSDVLLTVHLSIILVINQRNAQNFFL